MKSSTYTKKRKKGGRDGEEHRDRERKGREGGWREREREGGREGKT